MPPDVAREKAHTPKSLMRRFAFASVCALALLGPASSQSQPAKAPAPTTQKTDVIKSLKAEFNRTAQGRALLQFAEREHIAFVVDPALEKTNDLADYNPGYSRLRLRPNLSGEEAVIYAAHELRHGWQDKILQYADIEVGDMRPRDRWILRRFLEADAHAYSAYFEAQRMQQLGTEKKDFGDATLERDVALKLKAQFSSADGLTLKEYREIAMEKFLANLTNYDDAHLDLVSRRTTELGDKLTKASNALHDGKDVYALTALDIITQDIAQSPSPAAFEALLRHFGGTSLNEKAETSFSKTPAKTLLEDYPYRAEGLADPAARKGYIQSRLLLLDQLYITYMQWDAVLVQTVTAKLDRQQQTADAGATTRPSTKPAKVAGANNHP